MVTGTKTLVNSQSGSVDFSIKTSKTNYVDKAAPEMYKADSSVNSSKSKSEDFKDVLNSKASYKNQDEDVKRVSSSNDSKDDMDKIEELKNDLKELEEESKSNSKDDIEKILNQLLALLTKLGLKEENLNLKGQVNSENLKNLLESINGNTSSDNSLSAIMEKLMELMKNDSVKEGLDTDSLKYIEKILSNLNSKMANDNTEAGKNIKNNMKNLMSEVSNVLESKQNTKVLTLEDMLKSYSQDNKDGALGNGSNNNASEAAKNNKEVSKEDKFLNSLLDDNKDDSLNKINLFASRSQVIQNQSGDTVRGLTINKATFANDLIRDVKFMSTNAMKELTVKVNPGNLGEITIRLIQEDGLMKANLKANSKEATALLSQNLADIKKQLTEQNIKIADVKVEIYQDDTTFFSEQGFGRQLSEDQGRSSSNKSSAINNVITKEEELNDKNIASNRNNIEFFA